MARAIVPNLQEFRNQYNNSAAYSQLQVQAYNNDFHHVGSPAGTNVQSELYNLVTGASSGAAPAQQVKKAISTAFTNYLDLLTTTSQITGNNGANSC